MARKLAILGLKLTAADTKDGTAAFGRGTMLSVSGRSGESESDDGPEGSSEESSANSDSNSDSDDETPPRPRLQITIPGLKLTGTETKDGTMAVGKGTTKIVAAPVKDAPKPSHSESDSEEESDHEADRSPKPAVVRTSIQADEL